MEEIIKTIGLSKVYSGHAAVEDVHLSVNEGEIFGFLGLNGAGKTTTIRLLLGMIKPTSGECYIQREKVSVKNVNIWNDIGYIVETPHSYPELTVKENLEIIRKLRGLRDKSSVEWIMDKVKIKEYASKKAKHLSQGNMQRLGIAKAMIHQPKILILDEPTNGLDPAGVVEIRQLLIDIAKNSGVTVIVSSHKLEEISKIATNIAIIHKGKLIREIEAEQLEKQLKKILVLSGRNQEAMKTALFQAGYHANIINDNTHATSSYLGIRAKDAVNHPEKVATLLVNEGYPPNLLKVEKEDLEKYFLRTIEEYGGM